MYANPRQSLILDSTPWIPDSWYWILVFVNGTEFQSLWDPDSLSCIPDSEAQGSEFHKQKFPGFPYMGRRFPSVFIFS